MSASVVQTRAMLARDDEIRRLYVAGVTDTRQIASRFGVTERTAQRALVRAGLRPPRQVHTPQHDELRRCLADGMPANWAAETVGVTYNVAARVARHMPNRREHVEEWDAAWREISRDPKLRRIHDEIAAPHAKTA